MSNFQRALEIAVEAHSGQLDRAGQPYILHPMRLVMKMQANEERIVAALHDVAEDAKAWPLERIAGEGFSDDVMSALVLLTKPKGADYALYVKAIKASDLACKVKIADLEDNMDITRFKHYDEKSLKNVEKYHYSWLVLTGVA